MASFFWLIFLKKYLLVGIGGTDFIEDFWNSYLVRFDYPTFSGL